MTNAYYAYERFYFYVMTKIHGSTSTNVIFTYRISLNKSPNVYFLPCIVGPAFKQGGLLIELELCDYQIPITY